MSPFLGEFIGTMIFITLGNGVVANVNLPRTKGHNGGWIVITFGYAMAVFVAVWCSAEASGAHLNPAVTIGLAAADKFDASIATYVFAQMLGAIAGAALVYWFYCDHYAACDDADVKLGTFCTAPAIRNAYRNLFCETIGTAVFVFAVLMATDPSVEFDPEATGVLKPTTAKIGLGALGALPVALLVLSVGLSLGGTTGYGINPARDLGPRIAHALLPVPSKRDGDWSYAWIPVAGPVLGGLLAALAFRLLTK